LYSSAGFSQCISAASDVSLAAGISGLVGRFGCRLLALLLALFDISNVAVVVVVVVVVASHWLASATES